MSVTQTIIFGVGRSGTTALFDYLVDIHDHLGIDVEFRLEPFLWNIRTGEKVPDFSSTRVLSPQGIAAHVTEPLFPKDKPGPQMELFFDFLEIDGKNFLTKYIRACGRIETLMDRWPDAKCVFIYRNPSSVIDSATNRFSFFGDEFHPSDEERFCEAVGCDAEEFASSSYQVRQLRYWRHMNEAALQAAQRHPDRILPIAQESLGTDGSTTLAVVGRFLFGEDAVGPIAELHPPAEKKARGEKPFQNLPIEDFDAFNHEMRWYLETMLPACASGVDVDKKALSERIDRAWAAGQKARSSGVRKPYDPTDPPRDFGTLMLRDLLRKKRVSARRGTLSRMMRKLKGKPV